MSNFEMMSENDILMDLIGMDEWVLPEITADNCDDYLGDADW